MAQQAVFTVLERGCSIAVDEAIYLLAVSDKVESAKKQLQSMQAFLEDLDDKMLRGGSARTKNLVSEVREVAHEVEDINDTANILTRQSDPKISIRGAISKYACFPIYLTHLHKLGARIDSANARMKTIFADFEKFNIAATAIAEQGYISEDDTFKHWRSVHPDFGDEVDVIGFDDQTKQITDDLLDMDRENRHLTVVSIVGPGGAGKSTMAKKVYGLAAVKTHFELQAWVTVSQRFVPRDLLKEMVKILVPSHSLEMMIKRTIREEKAEQAKAKEVKELERFVPHSLLEEVVKRIMENEKANKAVKRIMEDEKVRLKEKIMHAIEERGEESEEVKYLLEKLIKHTMVDEKTEEAKVKEVNELDKLVPRHLLEEVLNRIIEDKKATEDTKRIPRHCLEGKIEHTIGQRKAKESKEEAEAKYLLAELIQRTIEDWKAEQSKETEAKFLLELLIMRSMEHEKDKAKTVELEELKEEQLTRLLHKFALSERYLIVLDDIWSTDAWVKIRAAFPDKKNGSRVVLTTRKEDVAQYPDARKKMYKTKLLNEEESTRLLLSKALPEYILDDMGQNLDELKKLGKDLAVKCCGLPLAIVVLGGHLSRHLDVAEWKRLTNSIDWHALIIDDRVIGGIMDLSYYDMPNHLRSCFIYTTAFPEDFPVNVRVLANLWVAEGFIPLVRDHTREEVAAKYITELVLRCMIQVEERTISEGITVIKVHDILRDWGIGLARKGGLIKDCHAAEDVDAVYSTEMKAYRVVLHGFLASKADGAFKSKPRTLLAFNFYSVPVGMSFKGWHHVRVLLLHCSGEEVFLPRDIGQMRYLRYLCLQGPCVYHLPFSIGDLLSLETMEAAQIYSIPSSLWKIPTLSYVDAFCVSGPKAAQGRRRSGKAGYRKVWRRKEVGRPNGKT